MADLTPEKKRAFDAIMGTLQRQAMRVLEEPKETREEVYEIVRQSIADTASDSGIEISPDFENMYMTHLRALVAIIERGGGAGGGRA
jgi:O-succinylbenzoate synthase